MKAIFNDVDNNTVSVIDVKPSKRDYCRVLRCNICCKEEYSIEGHSFGLVQNAAFDSNELISGINCYDNPELAGNFILLGSRAYKKDAKGVHVSKWSAVKQVKAKKD